MKRSDLSTDELLETVDRYRTAAWGRLTDKYPPKLVLAAIDRDTRRALLDWGVSPVYPWLTEKGRARLLDGSVVPTI